MSSPVGNFSVDPQRLQGAGQAAEHDASGVAGDKPEFISGVIDAMGSGLDQLALAQAVNDCSADWADVMDRLAAQMDQQGRNLEDTAHRYQQNEQGIEGNLRRIHQLRS